MHKSIAFIVGLLWLMPATATIRLGGLFSHHMVLQQQAKVPIWGSAKPGATVTITAPWAKQPTTTKASASGQFRAYLQTPAAGGPYTITLSDGTPTQLTDVLIGEVWLCSGQSNMQMPVKGFTNQPVLHATDLLLNARQPQIRLLNIGQRGSRIPLDALAATEQWSTSNAGTVAEFSALGWQYGLLLQKQLQVPIGLISATWGGTVIESWMSQEALANFPHARIIAPGDTAKLEKNNPAVNFNALIHPLIGYGIKGVIWYQGEQNRINPHQYAGLMQSMVADWRKRWGQGDFPFYYVQITAHAYSTDAEGIGPLREAQEKAQKLIANSGMAVTIDVGVPRNIHPPDKTTVAQRLGLWALANTYGHEGLPYQGPRFANARFNGPRVTLEFTHDENGLSSTSTEARGFELAGEDRIFYPATATITKARFTVSSAQVPAPVAVRYAFKDWTEASVVGYTGLPLAPFRTDDWPIPAANPKKP